MPPGRSRPLAGSRRAGAERPPPPVLRALRCPAHRRHRLRDAAEAGRHRSPLPRLRRPGAGSAPVAGGGAIHRPTSTTTTATGGRRSSTSATTCSPSPSTRTRRCVPVPHRVPGGARQGRGARLQLEPAAPRGRGRPRLPRRVAAGPPCGVPELMGHMSEPPFATPSSPERGGRRCGIRPRLGNLNGHMSRRWRQGGERRASGFQAVTRRPATHSERRGQARQRSLRRRVGQAPLMPRWQSAKS